MERVNAKKTTLKYKNSRKKRKKKKQKLQKKQYRCSECFSLGERHLYKDFNVVTKQILKETK